MDREKAPREGRKGGREGGREGGRKWEWEGGRESKRERERHRESEISRSWMNCINLVDIIHSDSRSSPRTRTIRTRRSTCAAVATVAALAGGPYAGLRLAAIMLQLAWR